MLIGLFSKSGGKARVVRLAYAKSQTLIKFNGSGLVQGLVQSGNKLTLTLPWECYGDGGTSTYRKID